MSQFPLPGKIGYGLMGFTWRPVQTPDEQAFEAMKTAIHQGATFFNGGEFYGPQDVNLKLFQRFAEKHPEYRKKVVLSVKGGINLATFSPDGTEAGVKKSLDNILSYVPDLELFECARKDPNVPIEETIGYIHEYVKAGKIKGISLSEVGADTIRRAASVAPISAVEVEYSLWSTEIQDNGVLATCAELNIPIVAYSPLGRGFLTGDITKRGDIPEGDMRLHFDRFSEENFPKNLELVDILKNIAEKKGITPAKLALSWILYQSGKPGYPVIIPIPGATTSSRVIENTTVPELSEEEFNEINDVLKSFTVIGGRYNKHMEASLFA